MSMRWVLSVLPSITSIEYPEQWEIDIQLFSPMDLNLRRDSRNMKLCRFMHNILPNNGKRIFRLVTSEV
jgi:hypothetical protein